jgi:hypothetical protein
VAPFPFYGAAALSMKDLRGREREREREREMRRVADVVAYGHH